MRQKRIYKTADEVLEEAAGQGGGGAGKLLASQPILDLRGPQARLVTDLEQLNATAGACACEGCTAVFSVLFFLLAGTASLVCALGVFCQDGPCVTS